MLGIILMIAKVIGLILLGILGLFAFLFLLVLLVPIPYRVWVSGDSADTKTLAYRIKIFGIQVVPMKKREKRKKKRIQDVPQTPDEGSGVQQQKNDDAQQTATQEPSGQLQTVTSQTQTSAPDQQPDEETASEKQTSAKKRKRPKTTKNKEKNTSGKDVRGMLDQLRAEFTDEGNRRALRHVFSEVRYLLRHFGPRRVRADVSFSLGDPANTGYATAALSICPFSYGKDCRILPDFQTEQLYLSGWLDMRGHMRTVHVLISGLRLLFDKDIRRIIGKIIKKKQSLD